MAHKIHVKKYSQKKSSDWAIISLILACIFMISGPGLFRAGVIMNIISNSFIIILLIGLLLTFAGLFLLLHSKLLKHHNKILASVLCFFASINSILLIEPINKIRLATENLAEAAAEAGIIFMGQLTEENIAIMDMMNFVFIVVFMIIGFILLTIYIYQCHLVRERMPPEPPGP